MALPTDAQAALLGLLEVAMDAKQAEQSVDENVRFVVDGREIKARVTRNPIDHPKGFVMYVTWRPTAEERS